jgi:predicted protein tyrosine phosphatase
MKITTEAHGSFPTDKSLASSTARIAFVNTDDTDRYLRATQVSPDLMIMAADDISEESTLAWLRPVVNLPLTLSDIVKRQVWASSRRGGFPSAPMSVADAVALLEFYDKLQERGVDHLIISCEYGKSRSVTAARFLRAILQNDESAKLEPIPNTWVNHMLELALKRINKTRGKV